MVDDLRFPDVAVFATTIGAVSEWVEGEMADCAGGRIFPTGKIVSRAIRIVRGIRGRTIMGGEVLSFLFSQKIRLLSRQKLDSAHGLTVYSGCVSVFLDMAMHVIIDGYNLLGVRGWGANSSSSDGERFRERLIQDLSRYRHRKGHPLTVVFDAWREPTEEHREHRSGVQVIYTKSGERADQVIQRMARQYGRDCVVVSSDLEIVSTAKAHGALTMRAREFHGKLQTVVSDAKHGTYRSTPSVSAGYGKVDEEPLPKRPDKKGNPRKLPKAQRQRNRQLRGF